MNIEDLLIVINTELSLTLQEEEGQNFPVCIQVPSERIYDVCALLHTHKKYYFDQLSSLSGVDNGSESGTMEVVYHLYSIPYNYRLALKSIVQRANPTIASVSDIWRTANWHEREAFDLFGIQFQNHPDLRRILLPNDWEGHPLRKDYQEQEKYHGMTVKYDRDDSNDELKMDN